MFFLLKSNIVLCNISDLRSVKIIDRDDGENFDGNNCKQQAQSK